MATTIRTATPADIPQILVFIRALATYEREPHAVTATEADLLRDGFGPNPFYSCLIAERDGQPAGFAFYFFNYSTWMGRPGLYLEDIFVQPEFRGLGIGKALLEKVAAIAVEKGCPRLQWEVLDWNTIAPWEPNSWTSGAMYACPETRSSVWQGLRSRLKFRPVPHPFRGFSRKNPRNGWETRNLNLRPQVWRPRIEDSRDRRRTGRSGGCADRGAAGLPGGPL
jgi:GNAT superfamily N-acetyltransferase